MDVAQDVVVTETDCGTDEGLTMAPVIEGGDIIESLGDRILGRVVARDVTRADSEEILVPDQGHDDRREMGSSVLKSWALMNVQVRSPITCETRQMGICAYLLRT